MKYLLRVEHLAIFAVATTAYFYLGYPWWLFVVLFFSPDLTFAGYLVNNKVGAVVYNCGHSFIGPLLLMVLGLFMSNELCLQLSLIWLAHIGFDRSLGYGLKTFEGFNYTHLGMIGKSKTQH